MARIEKELKNFFKIKEGIMKKTEMDMIKQLAQEDQDKVSYFIQLLMHQAKYHALRQEIALRREEVAQCASSDNSDIIKQTPHCCFS